MALMRTEPSAVRAMAGRAAKSSSTALPRSKTNPVAARSMRVHNSCVACGEQSTRWRCRAATVSAFQPGASRCCGTTISCSLDPPGERMGWATRSTPLTATERRDASGMTETAFR